MLILGIETSCDDTGIAVLEIKGKKKPLFSILANLVSSQVEIHAKYGGVYPMLAKRAHEKNLPLVLAQVLKQAKLSSTKSPIDAIALTIGPGLSPCLWAGLNFTKEIARQWKIPLIPVNHIEGHLLVGLLQQTNEISNFQFSISKQIFPAMALIVSGGHTQLVLVKGIGEYQIIGETRDDAAGECFDKTARILGLEYPGGPAIAREARLWSEEILLSGKPSQAVWHGPAEGGQAAERATPERPLGRERGDSRKQYAERHVIHLPRPMMHTKDYDFSFSGLKTAVLYDYQARPKKERESKEYVRAMAAEIQQAIVDVLISKTIRAAKEYNAKSIILGGGVAANTELRTAIKKECAKLGLAHLIPPPNLATDNGAMIAVAGYFNWLKGKYLDNPSTLEAQPNLRIA